MFRWISNLFTTRKAIFNWKSNYRQLTVKVLFRGSFDQSYCRAYAIEQMLPIMGEDEFLVNISFVGIEE